MIINNIIKLYENGNVQLCGLRGTGKDILTANVIARRKKPYVSNIDYGFMGMPFKYSLIASNNDYNNFITGVLNKYEYPYSDKTDIYLSDCGIYFPSQYCGELNKHYKDLPTFIALSRQLGQCNVHCNSQYIGRVWDKLREQGDIYIKCNYCKVLFGKIVVQKITLYEKYESCANSVKPLRLKISIFNKNAKQLAEIEKTKFLNANGKIKECLLIYRHIGQYNTRAFKSMLKMGGDNFGIKE